MEKNEYFLFLTYLYTVFYVRWNIFLTDMSNRVELQNEQMMWPFRFVLVFNSAFDSHLHYLQRTKHKEKIKYSSVLCFSRSLSVPVSAEDGIEHQTNHGHNFMAFWIRFGVQFDY